MLIVIHSLGTFTYVSITNYNSKDTTAVRDVPKQHFYIRMYGKISIFNRQPLQAAQFFLRSIHLVTTIAMSCL